MKFATPFSILVVMADTISNCCQHLSFYWILQNYYSCSQLDLYLYSNYL